MEYKGSLPHSQVPATCPYPKPARSSPGLVHRYLLTSKSRVLLEKLTGFQVVKEFPAFYGIQRFITTFTSTRQLSLSWASSIQSIPTYPTSWRSILILSCQARSIHQYKNLKIKVLKCCADIFFNRQCLTKKTVPNYANINVPITSPVSRITECMLCIDGA